MKQITIEIQDNKFLFIVELLDNLGIKDIHENDLYIPEWHKDLIMERMKNHDPNNAINLTQFDLRMQEKYGI